MAGCCNPRGCDRVFTGRFAARMASRYRKRGLDKTARRMVELLAARGIDGATVLEIGGGVGEIGVELLRRGAASATNLELSPGYETEASRLLAEAGLTARVQRRVLDIAADPERVDSADVVVLHRVVCCYPDYERLLGAAADRTRRQLAFSHPPRNPIWRTGFAGMNVFLRLRRSQFRVFTHPPAAMLDVLVRHGMKPSVVHRGASWHISAATR